MSLALHDAAKTYRSAARGGKDVVALDGVDLAAAEDELLVVVGPSGSGKSTLLRCVAGLELLDRGAVEVGGRDVTSEQPGDRDVAMMFQDLALYPHLTVAANISFGLRARKAPPAEISKKVGEAAEMLEISGVLERMPAELSGGERQRVALARCIVRAPKAFLLDEPLSNLDASLRHRTRTEIRALQRALGTTMLYVTHDQIEAMTMGDRVAVLRAGRLEQVGSPMELYDHPANTFVAGFIGNPPMNVVEAHVLGHDDPATPTAGIRPEALRFAEGDTARLKGTVEVVERLGSEAIVHFSTGPHTLLVRAAPSTRAHPGSKIGLTFRDDDVHLFDHEGRAAR